MSNHDTRPEPTIMAKNSPLATLCAHHFSERRKSVFGDANLVDELI